MRWLRELFERIRRGAGIPSSRWIYGTTGNGLPARCHRLTGRVEFLLWKPGEQGHADGFWAELGHGHEFIPDNMPEGPKA